MSIHNKKSICNVFVYVLVFLCMSIIACDTSGSKKEFPAGKTQLEKELSLSNTQKVSKLYLIGGIYNGSIPKNDVWSSSDGKNWEEETASAKFPARHDHQVVLFNGRMYLIGGYDGGYKNDVWSSTNGKDWEQETVDAEFSAREGHQVVVFNDRMYLIGGSSGVNGNESDVWSSSDGKNWEQEIADAEFSARNGHQAVVFNGKMYLIGGSSADRKNDVWSSTNGKDWEQETADAEFSNRIDHEVVVFQGKMYVIGGYDPVGITINKNDVWSSEDGMRWEEETVDAEFSAREGHQVVLFQGKLYLIGGYTNGAKNDVWSSSDGKNWEQEITTAASFSPRLRHQVVVFPTEAQ